MFYAVQISARARDMTELSQALCGFFFYAAGQPGHALDHDALRAALPGSADWLLEQFEGEESNRKKLKKAVDALFLLPAARRQAVADAVAHDMSFDQAADPARFYFWLPSLPGDERTIVHDFFVYFYETAFSRAVPPQLNGHACQATRAALIADYYRRNPVLKRVCPVCLHQRSKAEAENELDHYFPKAIYPPLAVHPWNLMFIRRIATKLIRGLRTLCPRAKNRWTPCTAPIGTRCAAIRPFPSNGTPSRSTSGSGLSPTDSIPTRPQRSPPSAASFIWKSAGPATWRACWSSSVCATPVRG